MTTENYGAKPVADPEYRHVPPRSRPPSPSTELREQTADEAAPPPFALLGQLTDSLGKCDARLSQLIGRLQPYSCGAPSNNPERERDVSPSALEAKITDLILFAEQHAQNIADLSDGLRL